LFSQGNHGTLKAQMSMEIEERVLREFSTFAVVGASRHPDKAAHGIPRQLAAAGFRIVPVNPHVEGELFGQKVYPSLSDIPFPVEVVVVFRPAEDAPAIAEQAARIGARALWLQQGIISKEARRIAEAAGLLYVEDRCTGVERAVHRIVKTKPADGEGPFGS
jgi:predicted CoA-binding protein